MIRKSFLLIGAIALATVTLSPAMKPHAFAQDGPKDTQLSANTNDLTGTWLTQITPPPEALPPFQGIFNFGADGTLVATQSGGEFPALGNPQLGSWSKDPSGKRQFTLTYYGQDFDQQFQLTDYYRVRGTVKLSSSGTSFTGSVDITVYDLDGNELFTDCCAAFEGTRGTLSSPAAANANVIPPNRHAGWSRRGIKP